MQFFLVPINQTILELKYVNPSVYMNENSYQSDHIGIEIKYCHCFFCLGDSINQTILELKYDQQSQSYEAAFLSIRPYWN